MPLVDLSQVKALLGIDESNTDDDLRLQAVLTSVLSTVEQLVGDLSRGTKTINILNDSVKGDILELQHKEIVSLSTIHEEDFVDPAKVSGTDYKIRPDGTVVVLDLQSFISNDFGAFDVVYVAGWEEDDVPDDFIQIVADMCALKFVQDYGRNVVEETTGPRTVRFEDTSKGSSSSAIPSQWALCTRKLRKYLPSHLRLW